MIKCHWVTVSIQAHNEKRPTEHTINRETLRAYLDDRPEGKPVSQVIRWLESSYPLSRVILPAIIKAAKTQLGGTPETGRRCAYCGNEPDGPGKG